MKTYLEFESEVKILEDELEKLKDPFNKGEGLSQVETAKISQLEKAINDKLTKNVRSKIFSKGLNCPQ